MSLIVFFSLFSLFSLLGYKLLVNPNQKNIINFTWIIAVFPFSSIFVSFYYKAGLLATDGIFLGLFLFLFSREKKFLKVNYGIVITLFFLLLWTVVNVFFHLGDVNFHLPSLFKDIKIISYIPLFYLFFKIIKTNELLFDGKTVKDFNSIKWLSVISFVAAAKCILFLYLNSSGFLGENIEAGDDFYSSDQEMMERYSDFSLPLVFSFLIVISFYEKNQLEINSYLTTLIASYFVISYASGNRTFFLVGIVLVFYILAKINKLVGFFVATAILSAAGLLIFYFGDVLYRLYSLTSFDLIFIALQTRYSPFFDWIKDGASIYSIIFGNGIGVPFYIPWFEYRDNLDPYSPFVDNFYLTFAYKYGFLGLFVLLLCFVFYLLCSSRKFPSKFFVSLAIFVCGLTMSVIYQSYFSIIVTWIILASRFVHFSKRYHD